MAHQRFIDDPDRLLTAGLRSMPLISPGVGLDAANKILYVRPRYKSVSQQRVSLISGGGAGHEPSFGAMVGPGLLSAAVVGTVFASPSAEQISTAITSRVDHNGLPHGPEEAKRKENSGALVVVMNYTGDVLNFGVAVERARAAGASVEMVVIGDDVSVERSRAGKVGRRGIAGTVLVHKICGALAFTGFGLSEVARVASLVAENVATIGATLDRVCLPGVKRKKEVGELSRDPRTVEVGMGIHNEQGCKSEIIELDALIALMLKQLLARDDPERSFVDFLSEPRPIVLLVNNLGGLGVLELGAITVEVVQRLEQAYGICPVRIYSGTYMTSLDSKGFSITLLRAIDLGLATVNILSLLDYPCEAPGWAGNAYHTPMTWCTEGLGIRDGEKTGNSNVEASELHMDPAYASAILRAGLRNVIACEPQITRFDLAVGDGDCGTTLKRGAQAILDFLDSRGLSGDVVVDIRNITRLVERTMDGTSGAIYAIFLNALITALRSAGPGALSNRVWSRALRLSADALGKYTPAKIGDRTLIDALHPFITALEETDDLGKAAAASLNAAQATKGMRPSLGRSVYIGGSDYLRVPDPGAWGLAQFFTGLANGSYEWKFSH